jgi:hypothetical protein
LREIRLTGLENLLKLVNMKRLILGLRNIAMQAHIGSALDL